MNRPHILIRILPVVLYLLLTVLYMLTIPPGESPDEPSHLQCIEQVTEYGRIPIIEPAPQGTNWWDRERIISGLVCAHMPLYYLGAGLTQRAVAFVTQAPTHYEFPSSDADFPASYTMFRHPTGGILPNTSEPASLTSLRLESILLGFATLVSAYILTLRLTTKDYLAAVFAMTLVAGWPQFLFMSRAINNDTLATALAVAALTIAVAGKRPRRYFYASTLSALSVFSKLTMFSSALGIAAIFLIDLASADTRREYLKPALASILVFAGSIALMQLHPTLRSHIEWSQASVGGISPDSFEISYWINVLTLTLQSGWGRFGWMGLPTPDWQALMWWGFLFVAVVIGIASSLIRPVKKDQVRLTFMSIAWIASILVSYGRINLNRFQPQFRYILPVVPVLAAYASIGFFELIARSPRIKKCAVPALAILLLLANLWIITALLVPNYR